MRNALHHVACNELDECQFTNMWTRVAISLRRLGTTEEELNRYKHMDLDPETTRMSIYEVKLQAMEDLCGYLQVHSI